MDELLKKAGAVVLELGFAGVVILVQGLVIYTLYKRVNELQDKLFTEARTMMATLTENIKVMDRLTDAIKTSISLRGRVE